MVSRDLLEATRQGFARPGRLRQIGESAGGGEHLPARNCRHERRQCFFHALRGRLARSPRRFYARLAIAPEAKELAQRINQKLYVAGKGWWKCGQPDGSFVEVRHCYDFLSVLDNMDEDLSETQKQEMSRFFWAELHSDYWMRALSPGRRRRHLEHPSRPQLAGRLRRMAPGDRQGSLQDGSLSASFRVGEEPGQSGQPGTDRTSAFCGIRIPARNTEPPINVPRMRPI